MAQGLVRTFGVTSSSDEEGFGLWREVDRVFDNIARSFGRGESREEVAKGFAGEILAPSEPLPIISDDDPLPIPRVADEEVHLNRAVQAKTEVLSPPQPTPIRLRTAAAPGNGPLSPVSDAFEDDDCYEVTVELPGIEESDIDIQFAEGAITITAERKRAEESEGTNNRRQHVRERSFGTFKRRFPMPFQANPDIIQARIENGVAIIHVPRPPETKPRIKKIDLKRR